MNADGVLVDPSAAISIHGNDNRREGFPVDVVSSNIHS